MSNFVDEIKPLIPSSMTTTLEQNDISPLIDTDTVKSIMNDDLNSNREKKLLQIFKCRKMYILYGDWNDRENWNEYCVTNPFDIFVVKNRSGLIDIYYTKHNFEEVGTDFGYRSEDKIEEFVVKNCKVSAIQFEYHSESDYKKCEIYNF